MVRGQVKYICPFYTTIDIIYDRRRFGTLCIVAKMQWGTHTTMRPL